MLQTWRLALLAQDSYAWSGLRRGSRRSKKRVLIEIATATRRVSRASKKSVERGKSSKRGDGGIACCDVKCMALLSRLEKGEDAICDKRCELRGSGKR